MKKWQVLVGITAGSLLAAAESYAEQQDTSPRHSADNAVPRSIGCSQGSGAALHQCSYRVKQDEKGRISVTVIFANGFERALFFNNGEFLKASVTMSGVGTDTEWSVVDGTYRIRVDGQRYNVPVSLIVEY
ncbi:hypothetical protein DU478_21555 [Thalassococcus profundi]|uniref:Uncharacterized protein n=1 Tax=Thalassococcus profundi TaxID=2282382 RepID=A0A369TG01_9RHOB|nr:hypothetical protein [Thalassococcus profundi]RDD64198.1 hypothetical protein DU478_21555 [Thalassococcus profundi]